MPTPLLIDTRDALESFVATERAAPWFGIDTEFVRDRNYFPRPGLIQIATVETTALVDPVRLDDLAPLAALLFATPTVKIFHAARQDLELLVHLFDRVPAPLFDTQVAAALCGLAPQIGYTALVAELLGAATGREFGRYDWLRRPLAGEAIRYAAGDVEHLHALQGELAMRLAKTGKEASFAQTMRLDADPQRYRPDPEGAWRRIRAGRRLRGPALARLRALAAWRERQAMAEDRPRQWLVGDAAIAQIARLNPRDARAFGDIVALRADAGRRYANAMLETLAGIDAGAADGCERVQPAAGK